jgi:hypothetical protein
MIAPVLPPDLRFCPLKHDDILDSGTLNGGFVYDLFQPDLGTAPIAAIRCNDKLALPVVDTIADRIGREATEYHGVRCTDPRTGEHRDRKFGNERHVERDAIARRNTELFQNVRKL